MLKGELVERLLAAKQSSGKSFDEIASEMNMTNAYVAQLFLGQAQLKTHRYAEACTPLTVHEGMQHITSCICIDC